MTPVYTCSTKFFMSVTERQINDEDGD